MRARPLFLRTVFQINFFGFPNRTVKTQIQKRISQRRNPFSDFACDCRSEMRILKSKSRFPNRTHPKNNHAFFLRSFVLVVCLFVCLCVFLFFLYSHRPLSSAEIHSRVIGFPLRKVSAGATTEHFRARTHLRHASLTLAKPLYASAEERGRRQHLSCLSS